LNNLELNNLVHPARERGDHEGSIAVGRIVDLPSIKPRSTSRRQGLRKLSPDLISKARDETATQVTRVGLTFLGTAAFCLLSLLSPDSALLGGSEKIIVPFAGPVSFFGFMLLGPAVLIALRVYLQIYVEHSDRLDRLARSVSVVRAPTLLPLQNSLIRLVSGLVFYMLLPVAMMLFAWKAAVFPAWGSGLFGFAVAAIASHVMLPFTEFSWRSKGMLSVSAAIITGGVMLGFGPLHRQFDLYHANLSGQWLLGEDLPKANLSSAELTGVNLIRANLRGANLIRAYLRGADLSLANLIGANLTGADLTGANLSDAHLSDANLRGAKPIRANLTTADLSGADLTLASLTGANLTGADLTGANLSDADLIGANLSGADLIGANLIRAYLRDANLSLANLRGANLIRAKLRGADLFVANLGDADLSGAHLSDANLTDANLSGADLTDADLSGANLRGANLSSATSLTPTQLSKACGDSNTKLPEGLKLKPCSTD
jgi:uncharacterized protein YjbI with pentapeptide repeats